MKLIEKSTVPVQRKGPWRVATFKVSDAEASAFNLRCMLNDCTQRGIVPGRYTKLTRNGNVIMSDTPAEIRDHAAFVKNAHGHVLIAGLGLGLVAQAALRRPRVKSVTVLEIDRRVVKMVAQHIRSPNKRRPFRVVVADVFTWKPDRKFDCAWFDIWPTIAPDNVAEFTFLRKRYRRHVTERIGFWCEREAKAHKRRTACSRHEMVSGIGDGNDKAEWDEQRAPMVGAR